MSSQDPITTSDGQQRKPLLTVVACQMGAFLLLMLELDGATMHRNRFLVQWSGADLLAYLLGSFALGVALYLASVLLRAILPRWHDAICVTAWAASIAFVLWRYLVLNPFHPLVRMALVETPLAFLAGILVAGLSWRFDWTFEKWLRGLFFCALFVSALLPMYWFNALFYSTYEGSSAGRLEELPRRADAGPEDNVFIFIFDAWSHRLTFDGDGLTSEFSNLEGLSRELFLFENAHSPSKWTTVSIPRMIFGRGDNVRVSSGRIRFEEGEDQFTDVIPSLFTRARERGMTTYAIGWGMPYRAILGSSVDYVRAVPEPCRADQTFLEKLGAFYWRAAIKLLPAGVIRRTPLTTRGVEIFRRHVHNTETLLSHAESVLQDPRGGQFALLHLPVPHSPFVFDRAGARSHRRNPGGDVVAQAREQHAYVATLIESFVAELRARGKYESSTLVFTGDHGWRHDPELPQPLSMADATRVPLLIKVPGQTAAGRISTPFSTVNLGSVLEEIYRQDFESADIPGIIERTPFVPVGAAAGRGLAFEGR